MVQTSTRRRRPLDDLDGRTSMGTFYAAAPRLLRFAVVALAVLVAATSLSGCAQTRIRDSFDRPDASALGTATTGQAWTLQSGSWRVQSGTARPGVGYSLATVAGSQTDGIAAVTVVAPSSEFWLVFRSQDGGTYWRFGRWLSGPYVLQEIESSGFGTTPITSVATLHPNPGDRLTCRYLTDTIECSTRGQVVARAAGVTDSATGVGLASFDPGGSGGLVFDDLHVTDVPELVDVTASMSGPTSVLTGGTATWIAAATNNGTVTRNDIELTVDLPPDLTEVTVTPSQGTCAGAPLNCVLGTVEPGQSVTVTVTGRAPDVPGTLDFTAVATTADADPDVATLTSAVIAPANPGAEVVDGFDRVGPALGTTDTGQPWTVASGSFATNGAEAVAGGSGTSLALIDAPFSYGTLEVTVADTGTGSFWVVFGASDAANYYRVGPGANGNYRLQKVVGGIAGEVAMKTERATIAAADGDVIRVVRRPDDGILVLINDQHLVDAGDAQFMDTLGFGFAAEPGARFGHFRLRSVMSAGIDATDSFNRPDGSMGALDGAIRYPWWFGWGFGIAGNAAAPTGPYYSVAAVDASSELADARVTVPVMGPSASLLFRYAEDGSYFSFGRQTPSVGYAVTYVDGTGGHPPSVEVLSSPTPADGDVIEVRQNLDGLVECLVNGQIVLRFTDATTNARATAYGVAGQGAATRFDDLVVEPR